MGEACPMSYADALRGYVSHLREGNKVSQRNGGLGVRFPLL